MESSETITNVLLTFRHSGYLYGEHTDDYPDLPNSNPGDLFADSFPRSKPGDYREVYWQSFQAMVSRLLKAGKTVYVQYPVPELPVHIAFAVVPFTVFESEARIDLERAVSAKYYFDRNAFIIDKLDTLPYSSVPFFL